MLRCCCCCLALRHFVGHKRRKELLDGSPPFPWIPKPLCPTCHPFTQCSRRSYDFSRYPSKPFLHLALPLSLERRPVGRQSLLPLCPSSSSSKRRQPPSTTTLSSLSLGKQKCDPVLVCCTVVDESPETPGTLVCFFPIAGIQSRTTLIHPSIYLS